MQDCGFLFVYFLCFFWLLVVSQLGNTTAFFSDLFYDDISFNTCFDVCPLALVANKNKFRMIFLYDTDICYR